MSRERALEADAAGRFLEAARAWESVDEPKLALDSLARVGPGDPQYREACRRAIRLAAAEGPSLAVENLLAAYVRWGPQDDADADAFLELADLYLAHGFSSNAGEALRKLLAFREDAAARALLDRLAAGRPEPTELPDLPDLPELPEPHTGGPVPGASAHLPTVRTGPGEFTAADEPSVEWSQPFRVGATIGGRYRLDSRIGAGGMSVVFKAADLEVGDEIALKVFTQGVFDRETDARLRRELLLSRRLNHRNLVRLFDMGLAHGFRFVTMELLVGQDLRERMRGVPLPVTEAIDVLSQTCEGLQSAHQQGIVHRDVKPENLFLVRGGLVKVMDFGIAKLHSAPGITATGILAGTPAYIAPEQVRDFRNVTPAADIYGLGVVAYEALTGSLPFNHPEPMQLLMMQLTDKVPPLRERNREVPAALERLVLECLEKDPGLRPPSCGVIAARLAELIA